MGFSVILTSSYLNYHCLWSLFIISLKKIWVKVFKNGPSKISRRQPLKDVKRYSLLRQIISLQLFSRLCSANFTWPILKIFEPFWNSQMYIFNYFHIFSYVYQNFFLIVKAFFNFSISVCHFTHFIRIFPIISMPFNVI